LCSAFCKHIRDCRVVFHSRPDSYENIIWGKPYSHAAAYVAGAWLGYLLHSQQGQHVRLSRVSICLAGVFNVLLLNSSFFNQAVNTNI